MYPNTVQKIDNTVNLTMHLCVLGCTLVRGTLWSVSRPIIHPIVTSDKSCSCMNSGKTRAIQVPRVLDGITAGLTLAAA